jgi:hypothetical protein
MEKRNKPSHNKSYKKPYDVHYMNRLQKHHPTKPTPANPHFGTFTFFQPRQATAHKNVKEPKFSNRTPTTTSISAVWNIINTFITTLIHFDPP